MFYSGGDSLLSLPKDELPDFPFLVVKSNERMKVSNNNCLTRSRTVSSYSYQFIDPAFDNTKPKTTRASYYTEDNTDTVPDEKPYIKTNNIDPLCVEAYKLGEKDKYLMDRDYIYYNISSTNDHNGRLNPNIREKLYKIKVNAAEFSNIADEGQNEPKPDPQLKDYVFYKKGHPNGSEIAKALWTDGKFEFMIYSFSGNSSSTDLVEKTPVSVSGNDLFYISKFDVRRKHSTGFRHQKWWYSTEPEFLKSRWVDVSSANVYLGSSWDLSQKSQNMYIKVMEMDSGTEIKDQEEVSITFTDKSDFGISGGDTVKYNAGYDTSKSTTHTVSLTYQYTQGSDDLGSAYLNYKDPIIVSDKEAATKGYEINSVNTNGVSLIIAPVSVR